METFYTTPPSFDLASTIQDAIRLANDFANIWLLIIGMGMGVSIMAAVWSHFRRATTL